MEDETRRKSRPHSSYATAVFALLGMFALVFPSPILTIDASGAVTPASATDAWNSVAYSSPDFPARAGESALTQSFTLTFAQSGLPPSGSWWVNLAGNNRSSLATASIIFQLPNGTYSFLTGASGRFVVVPGGGSVRIAGTPQTINESFRVPAVSFAITFRESGLPPDASWFVVLNSTNLSTMAGQPLTFILANATYSYTIGASGGYVGVQSNGQVVVRGSDQTETVAFALPAGGGGDGGLPTVFYLWLGLGALLVAGGAAIAVRAARYRRSKRAAFRREVRYTRTGDASPTHFPPRRAR